MAEPGAEHQSLTLRGAALIAGIAYLLMPITIAEFAIYPRLVIASDAAKTVQNITVHGSLFALAILCYLLTLILDIVIAWALYYLLAPVNRHLSMLAACFRMVFAAVALSALLNLVDAHRIVNTASYAKAFGAAQIQAQVMFRLGAYRSETSFNLIIFAIHLFLIGVLVIRSGYIPKLIGALLILDGLIWIAAPLRPFFYPTANLNFLFPLAFTELLFPVWLLIRARKLPRSEGAPAT